MLIVLVLVMTLIVIMLKSYQKSITAVAGPQAPAASSIQNIRSAVKDIEKAAAQRADLEQHLYQ
mgnify:CR=1 FL=1